MPFGEEVAAGTGGRTAQQGYSQADGVRQKYTGFERDNETGLDFADARYYASAQGRFTSIDPIFITPERQTDPQQLNLYVYVRNNPLVLVDPTGQTIDDANLKDNKEYQTWKDAFRNTDEGKRLWSKYDDDKNFTLKIEWDKGRNGAVADDYKFADGKLVGATITLGSELDKGSPNRPSDQYPVQNALAQAEVGGTMLAVAAMAHEFGHVEDASQRPAFFQSLQEYNDLSEKLSKELGSKFASDPRYIEKEKSVLKAGGYSNTAEMGVDNERRAEKAIIPVIQQRLDTKMPKSVRKVIGRF
jgi:RHS repeat-associated protein